MDALLFRPCRLMTNDGLSGSPDEGTWRMKLRFTPPTWILPFCPNAVPVKTIVITERSMRYRIKTSSKKIS
jgi:hypothetical protein